MRPEVWTIIGGGHGGQTFAGHMALLGKRVRLYTHSKEKSDLINKSKEIRLEHAISGVGKLEFATSDMKLAISGATHIIIVLPSIWHNDVEIQMIPYLEDGQFILILPEASCGALSFRKLLIEHGCKKNVIIGAGCDLPYATRSLSPCVCHVHGIKNNVKIAALPSKNNELLKHAFCDSFPYFTICKNVIETSLDNRNALMHPAPVLLNISRIEANPPQSYEYYLEGITPSICNLIEAMDEEINNIAISYGVSHRKIKSNYIEMYGCGDDTMSLCEIIRNNKGYIGIENAKSVRVRNVLEDVPYSLEAIRTLAEISKVETPCINSVISIWKAILKTVLGQGRTVKQLGLNGIDKNGLLKIING